MSASWFPTTVVSLIRERKYSVLVSAQGLRDVWFGNFWGWAGPNIREMGGPIVIPLLEGRTSGGKVVDEPVGAGIGGTVLEIGAGSGFWVDIFSNRRLDQAPNEGTSTATDDKAGDGPRSRRQEVTRVYGIEPNRDQHANLRRHIEKAGLDGIYQIVPVGIEDLDNSKKWDGSIEKGSVDCIVSILCLCSIPDPEKNIKELYGYLKEGGRWYVYEHVKCEYSWYMKAYQRK
ncbi:hypothetical protein MGN70_008146 [Eutypa lata]|nr:hypothetical protein MGN70_008146 [Eutypa lata]